MSIERTEELGGYHGSGLDPRGTYRKFVTSLSAVPLFAESSGRCHARGDDGLCGIYERRPAVCRYVPAQHLLHRDRQNRAIEIFYAEHAEDCDWTAAAPVVLDRGKIVEPAMAAALDLAEEDDRRDGSLLHALVAGNYVFSPGGDIRLTIGELLSNSMESPGGFNFPFALVAIFLDTLRADGTLPDGYGDFSVRDLALKQIEACETMIQDNLRRRDKRDREVTGRLRALKEVNEAVASKYRE